MCNNISIEKKNNKKKTIDNIIINSILNNDFESAITKTDVSDHFPIILIIKLKTNSSPKIHADQFIHKRDFKENSLNLFKEICLKHLGIVWKHA